MRKPFYKNVRFVVCKKPFEKTPTQYSRDDTILKIGHLKCSSPCIGYSLCKMVSLGQKLKMPKRCEKPFYKTNRVFLCEKLLKKHKILEK